MTNFRWSLALLLLVGCLLVSCRESDESARAPEAPAAAVPAASNVQTSDAAKPDQTPATPKKDFSGMVSVLRPPTGYKVGIVVFEDLQCPSCGLAEPVLKDAERTYKIPLVRHDFPIPQHNWSSEAHLIARYFDSQSKALGEEFRHFIFMNQMSVTKENLRGTAEKFAGEHKITLPFVVDPTGKFAAQIQEDYNLGRSIGVYQTPTIYIVGDGQAPLQVTDRSQLFQDIDQMMKRTGA